MSLRKDAQMKRKPLKRKADEGSMMAAGIVMLALVGGGLGIWGYQYNREKQREEAAQEEAKRMEEVKKTETAKAQAALPPAPKVDFNAMTTLELAAYINQNCLPGLSVRGTDSWVSTYGAVQKDNLPVAKKMMDGSELLFKTYGDADRAFQTLYVKLGGKELTALEKEDLRKRNLGPGVIP